MNAFTFMPLWCAFLYFIADSKNFKVRELSSDESSFKYKIGFVIITFIPLFWIVAIAEPCMDAIAYLNNFDKTIADVSSIEMGENGWGFSLFTVIVKKIFGSQLIYRILIALIHSVSIIYIFYKFSDNYLVSFFIFIASATYHAWMMNGLRQFMAVSIILLSIPYLIKKKYLKVCLLVLLATAIHQTAIIMLPVLLLVSGKPFNKYTIFFIIISIAAMSIFSLNSKLFEAVIGETEYALGYEYVKENDGGVNPIRVLLNAVPVIFAFISKEKLIAENDAVTNISINMSMVTLGTSLVAMVTSGIFVGRLMIYTQLFNFIIMPKLINKTFDKKSIPTVYFFMVLLYLVYYKMELGNFFYYNLDLLGGLR